MMSGPDLSAVFAREYPSLLRLYQDLHAHPELSGQEAWTSERVGKELEAAGFATTRGVGGYGVIGVLTRGTGPVVMLRADMDGLPLKEETGLPYTSREKARDARGQEVDVMHACGHDLHVAALIGAARVLAACPDWSGTLVMVGQPSEETVSGAARMIADGLFSRFPRPDAAIALHVAPEIPAGTIGWREGIISAGGESLDIVVCGIGGHAAHPERARDPVVLAAQIILAFQTIVSREVPPGELGIITVASVHGGSKHNAIPDEVLLQVNIRYFRKEVRDLLLNAIKRVTEGIARSAGMAPPLFPRITLLPQSVPPMTNDPALTRKVADAFIRYYGEDHVLHIEPVTGSEDFGVFGLVEPRIPICYFRIGCGDEKYTCGFLHSSRFAPPPEVIRDAAGALVVAAQAILDQAPPHPPGR
ncbi:MAG TPA: amidohydrolase [Methanoregulaceae archaeon]|nr:amidohydrolase [Methanoregulaceae archaeon]